MALRPSPDYGPFVTRRLASLAALLSVVAAPVASESRLVCRYTGEVIVGCPEEQIPDQPVVREVGCCDRRVTARMDAASNVESQRIAAPLSVVIAVSLPQLVPGQAAEAPAWNVAAPSIGPPIFITTRALLI